MVAGFAREGFVTGGDASRHERGNGQNAATFNRKKDGLGRQQDSEIPKVIARGSGYDDISKHFKQWISIETLEVSREIEPAGF
jgi:hypothetical protein